MGFGRLDLIACPLHDGIAPLRVGPAAVVAEQVGRRSPPEGGVLRRWPGDGATQVPQGHQALIGGRVLSAADEIVDQGVVETFEVDRLPVCIDFRVDRPAQEEGIKGLLPGRERAAARQVQHGLADAAQRRQSLFSGFSRSGI